MATRKKATTTSRTATESAGKPVQTGTAKAAAKRAAVRMPSLEDLDLRDRLKAGPRRPAGPPLSGDTPTQAAMEALRTEVLPPTTDPKKPRGGK
ncbi:hypothetical protein [Variovorax sp. J22R115]|uniref:hypothetical protein n=1 Tax=Variovorax sp. J22R115 TaxID=3053509 RepID=UPI002577E920|nr:hypothetical protein [Variovorax sp. J22R115]MDM0053014.1 hypothetical protein [Variovorax sp. J22R115]